MKRLREDDDMGGIMRPFSGSYPANPISFEATDDFVDIDSDDDLLFAPPVGGSEGPSLPAPSGGPVRSGPDPGYGSLLFNGKFNMARKRKRSWRSGSRRGGGYASKKRYARAAVRNFARKLQNFQTQSTNAAELAASKYGPNSYQLKNVADAAAMTQQQYLNRVADGYFGRGDYKRHVMRGLGGLAGAGWAAYRGGDPMAGWKRGYGVGGTISKAVGWGDVVTNDLIDSGDMPAPAPPVLVNPDTANARRTGEIVLSHREFIGNVYSSSVAGQFKAEHYDLNVADKETFRQLSYMSKLYEKFQLQGCVFEYVPLSGDGGTTNQLGKVMMVTNADPRGTLPGSSEDIHSMSWKNSAQPAISQRHAVETHPDFAPTKYYYVRDNNSDRPVEFTDPGTFTIATEGVPTANALLGELWVSYNVKLMNIKKIADEDREDNVAIVEYQRIIPDPGVNWSITANVLTKENVSGNFYSRYPPEGEKLGDGMILSYKQDLSTNGGFSGWLIEIDKRLFNDGDMFKVSMAIYTTQAGTGSAPYFGSTNFAVPGGCRNCELVLPTFTKNSTETVPWYGGFNIYTNQASNVPPKYMGYCGVKVNSNHPAEKNIIVPLRVKHDSVGPDHYKNGHVTVKIMAQKVYLDPLEHW